MVDLSELIKNNSHWSANQRQSDPDFFTRLVDLQTPRYLWIGCADSRVPANEIVGLAPGELFVHRNIANVVPDDDPNCLSVIQYAVDSLHIEHIIVCGHYGCGGVKAAMEPCASQPLDNWLSHIRKTRQHYHRELASYDDEAAQWKRLCELNVIEQVRTLSQVFIVTEAWKRKQPLSIHGWIYDLHDGLIHDLNVSSSNNSF